MGMFFRRCVSLGRPLVAGGIIAVAIVMSAVRLALPAVDGQRAALATWAAGILGRPVVFGTITAKWRGWSPSINIADVTLLDTDGRRQLLQFRQIQADIAPLASLRARTLVPRRLLLHGSQLTLERAADGSISVAGMAEGHSHLLSWLLQQHDLTITDLDITFVDASTHAVPVLIPGFTLAVSGDGHDSHIRGLTITPAGAGESVRFDFSAQGDLQSEHWRGDLNIATTATPLRLLLAYAPAQARLRDTGTLDASLWIRWDDAHARHIVYDLKTQGLQWQDPTTTPALNSLAVSGRADRIANGWAFGVRGVSVNGNATGADPKLRAFLRNDDGTTRLELSAASLPAETVPLLTALSAGIAPKAHELLTQLQPHATLSDLLFGLDRQLNQEPHYYLRTAIQGLSTQALAQVPAVEGLSTTLRANRGGGVLSLRAADFRLTHAQRLLAPLQLAMTGPIVWSNTAAGWRLATPGLSGRLDDISLDLRGSLAGASGAPTVADLTLDINTRDISLLHHLLPLGLMHEKGEHWMRNAFRSGRLSSGTVALRGALQDFPFDHAEGSFQADLTLEDVLLDYSDQWPRATAVNATVALAGRAFTGVITSGRFYDATIKETKLALPDIFSHEPKLQISGTVSSTLGDTVQFINESPLAKTKAQRVADLEIDGSVEIALDLNLGLSPAGEKSVLGQVRLNGNRVVAKRENFGFDDVHGNISFTHDDWYGENLSAVYEGQAVGLVVNGGLADPNYDSEFRMTGTADGKQVLADLERHVPTLYHWLAANDKLSAFNGATPWKAVLTIPEPNADGSKPPKRLLIESSLNGLAIDMPWPFGKTVDESRPLRIETQLGTDTRRVTRVGIGEDLHLRIDHTRGADAIQRVAALELAFGPAELEAAPRPGVYAHGEIASLQLSDWAGLLKGNAAPEAHGIFQLPFVFDVRAHRLNTLGQTFEDVQLSGRNEPRAWVVTMTSAQAAGEITIPHDMKRDLLTLNLARLWLDKIANEEDESKIDPRRIPAFVLSCESFKYGQIDLGHATIATGPLPNGLRLDTLLFKNAAFVLQAKGDWQLDDTLHKSHFEIDVSGKKLGGILQTFGYDVAAFEGGRTKINIDAAWIGMPSEFTLDRLDGKLDLRVKKGRFLDIEPGTGRLFGLLSLQMLPRRLSLDFTDLFKKGFSFNRIEGAFELDKGNAFTNSLLMEGPSARIDVSGRTGLAAQDYDQRVVVTPALASSIPLASALFGPAGIGVGAAIYLGQQVFKGVPEQLNKLLSRNYAVTGSWQHPIIEKL